MTTKTIVITGASSGIGASAARTLAAHGHDLVLVGRDPARTAALGDELGQRHIVADFASLADVERVASELRGLPRIDVLCNNAGAAIPRRIVTGDGFEATLQVNYLAPFLLTHLLLDKLIEDRSALIQTSSMAHRLYARLDLDDLNSERRYNVDRAYGNAKLAILLFTREVHRRYGERGLDAVAFHPGVVATGFGHDLRSGSMQFLRIPAIRRLFMRTPDQGADTLVWLAEGAPGKDWQPGRYYVRRAPARISRTAANDDIARDLWERTTTMLAPWLNAG